MFCSTSISVARHSPLSWFFTYIIIKSFFCLPSLSTRASVRHGKNIDEKRFKSKYATFLHASFLSLHFRLGMLVTGSAPGLPSGD